jgi:autotransporter strand-loop-strand O-heptosyltransferase
MSAIETTSETSAPNSSGSASAPAKPAYPPPAASPTQEGPRGIRYDFNLGCRVVLPPQDEDRQWRVRLRDLGSGNTLFETTLKQGFINSSKRWFVRFRIEVWSGEDLVLQHDYDARGRPVLIQFPIGTLGDTMGWFPYAARFASVHGCKLTCAMSALIIPLFKDAYPHITFVTHEEVKPEVFYATYCLGLFFDDTDTVWQPTDFRMVGLHRTAGYILGVDPAEEAPTLALPDESRPIAEP